MKYRGGKPRGFTVLTARPKPGQAGPSQANVIPLDRPTVGRLDVTPNARCIREGRRLHPARQLLSHHTEDVDGERSRISNPSQSALD